MRFNTLTRSKIDLPLSGLCQRIQVNFPDPPNAMDGVGTDTHLHAIHAPNLLVAISVEREVFTGMGVGQRQGDKYMLSEQQHLGDYVRFRFFSHIAPRLVATVQRPGTE